MFDDYSNLRPLKKTAILLAKDDSWGRLYDLDRLAKNTVKVTAATYASHPSSVQISEGFSTDGMLLHN